MQKRDSQRGKVYAAERAWDHGTKFRAEFPTKWEAGEFLTRMWKWAAAKRGRTPWVPTEEPRLIIRKNARRVRPHGIEGVRTRSFAYPYQNKIRLGELNSYALIHEFAHLCAPPGERHGPLFVQAYLTLLKEFMGFEAAMALSMEFDKLRVRAKPKRRSTRKISPERRAQLVAQLAKARAARAEKREQIAASSGDGPESLKRLLRFG